MTLAVLLDYIRTSLAALVGAGGVLVMLGGVIGLLRFPDAFTRLHAAGVTMSLGAAMTLTGLLILSNTVMLAAHLAFLILLIAAIAPSLSHVAGRAAHAAGLAPMIGAYSAPRPGARVRP